jgi:hypothetical protein
MIDVSNELISFMVDFVAGGRTIMFQRKFLFLALSAL